MLAIDAYLSYPPHSLMWWISIFSCSNIIFLILEIKKYHDYRDTLLAKQKKYIEKNNIKEAIKVKKGVWFLK